MGGHTPSNESISDPNNKTGLAITAGSNSPHDSFTFNKIKIKNKYKIKSSTLLYPFYFNTTESI